MTIDYSERRNLIIPTPSVEPEMVLLDEGGLLVVLVHGRLYISSDRTVDPLPWLERSDVETALFPSKENVTRWLLYKKGQAVREENRLPSNRAAAIYNRHSPWHVDRTYLARLEAQGEKILCEESDGRPACLAYTTKGCHQLNCLFTRREERGKGLATALLEETGEIHIFVDDPRLLKFYTDRGFDIVATYSCITRRKT